MEVWFRTQAWFALANLPCTIAKKVVLLLLDEGVCDVTGVLLVVGFVQFLSTQLHCPSSCTDYLSVEISRENCEFSYFSFQFCQFLLSSI